MTPLSESTRFGNIKIIFCFFFPQFRDFFSHEISWNHKLGWKIKGKLLQNCYIVVTSHTCCQETINAADGKILSFNKSLSRFGQTFWTWKKGWLCTKFPNSTWNVLHWLNIQSTSQTLCRQSVFKTQQLMPNNVSFRNSFSKMFRKHQRSSPNCFSIKEKNCPNNNTTLLLPFLSCLMCETWGSTANEKPSSEHFAWKETVWWRRSPSPLLNGTAKPRSWRLGSEV